MLVLLAALAALLGGSARADVPHLLLLRPASCVFLGFALTYLGPDERRLVKWPLIFLGLLIAMTAIQLVPLPYGLWTALPGRDVIAEVGATIGAPEQWRPLSLVPARTANALAGLIIPLSGLLLFAACKRTNIRSILYVIVGLGLANAILGILQILAGPGPLYFYPITNVGSPVGFFANHNHSAVFAALVLVVIAYLSASGRLNRQSISGLQVLLPGIYFVVFTVILINRSRAGLLAAAVALALSAIMLVISSRHKQPASLMRGSGSAFGGKLILGLFAAASLFLFVTFFAFDNLPALSRLVDRTEIEDLRSDILPTLINMISAYFPVGSGFGSFEDAYYIFEPAELLMPSYVNQAHNDWLQWMIESGLPGVILLLAFLGWFGFRLLQIVRNGGADSLLLAVMGGGFFVICALGSLVDYPLRTPLFQLVSTWLVAVIAVGNAPTIGEGGVRPAKSDFR